MKKHAVIFISDDLQHDQNAVAIFLDKTSKLLNNLYGIVNEFRFSDCCAGQYRSKSSFVDISTYSTNIEHHFFESSHGKNSSDGLNAIVKSAASRAVMKRQVRIQNAQDFFNFCEERLSEVGANIPFPSKEKTTANSKRTFFYIARSEIELRTRSDKMNLD